MTLSESSFARVFDEAPIGMAIVGLDGRFRTVNRALCAILGYPAEVLVALAFQEITHPDELGRDVDHAEDLVAGRIDRYQMEKRYITASGAVIWALLSVSLVRNDEGEPQHFISVVQDISDHKKRESSLIADAESDVLTGVQNRRWFEHHLHMCQQDVRLNGTRMALVVLDVDKLKDVNDAGGHPAGDEMLTEVATTICERLRSSDKLARVGGDEFAFVLKNVGPAQAHAFAREIVDLVEEHTITTVSVGVAVITGEGNELDYQIADEAMYEAKKSGGNRVVGPMAPQLTTAVE